MSDEVVKKRTNFEIYKKICSLRYLCFFIFFKYETDLRFKKKATLGVLKLSNTQKKLKNANILKEKRMLCALRA